MKTKDLIKMLQEADPSGETEVNCTGTGDPYCCDLLPGYYDGSLFILQRDPAKLPYWNVTGGRITKRQQKLIIRSLEPEDILIDHPETPFEFDPDDGVPGKYQYDKIERLRQIWRQEPTAILEKCGK